MAKELLNKLKPKIRDVFDSIQPLHVFSCILGVTNFGIVECSNRRQYRLACLVLTRQILQTLAIAVLSYIEVEDEINIHVSKIRFSDIVMGIEVVIDIVLSIATTVISILFVKRIISIVNKINDIDFELRKLNIFIVDWYVFYQEEESELRS
ncbi:hypothetical protein Trydic_g6451 [Trypoxylus dichotomus]